MVMSIKTHEWNSAAALRSDEEIAAYVDAAIEDGDPALLAHALGVVARVRGMTQVARDAGLGRESLYKALSGEGNPSFDTIVKVIRALNLELHVTTGPT
jgi:probable addiction module antidote protein